MRFLVPALSAAALTVAAIVSIARGAEVTAGDIVVTQAWARATPPNATTGAVYLTIVNRGGIEDRLVSAASPSARMAMVHVTAEENGVSTMRESDAAIAPGGTLSMKPGGIHVMLTGLTAPLKQGGVLTLNLVFARAGPVTLEAPIAALGAEDAAAAPTAPMPGMQ